VAAAVVFITLAWQVQAGLVVAVMAVHILQQAVTDKLVQQILAAAVAALVPIVVIHLAAAQADLVLLSYLTQTHIRQHLQRLVRQQ
jgi:hypothetical protein